MNNQERLEKIKAKCLELLAIAEKNQIGIIKVHLLHDRSVHKPFEASLKSTIAAIDLIIGVRTLISSLSLGYEMTMALEEDIIAAWPLELLS